MDVRSLMRQSARMNAERTAVVHGSSRLTYAEAWSRAIRTANGLLALGLAPGDRIGVLEDNSVGAQDLFAGATIAGLVRVPLYARNSVESHHHMLEHTGCRAIVVADHYRHEVDEIRDRLPRLENVVVRDDGYEDWLHAQSTVDPEVSIDPDDWFIIRHTGGTTGPSKGVAYTHRSWLAAGRDWFYLFPPMIAGDACLHVGPISHGSGYLYTPTWLSGGTNVMLDHFDPADTLETIESERIGYMFAVPAMLNALARHPDAARRDLTSLKVVQIGYMFAVPAMLNSLARHPDAAQRDLTSLKVVQIGGAPIADETALIAREVFGDVLFQGYGQTEALPVSMMGPAEWFSEVEGSNPLRSAGRALPFAELQIRDPDDSSRELPIGAEGEIAIHCDGQMLGFWDDPEASASRITDDGFVLTGDIGRIDSNGYLYVLDRKDDMIISGGFNIWPAELENVIADHPSVIEVAVFAVPDDRWGETPMAVCVVEADNSTDDDWSAVAETISTLCAERLGGYKKPGRVELRTEPLPKSPVGKIQRKVLREPFWTGRDRRVAGN